MTLAILHIDDEEDILTNAAKVIAHTQIDGVKMIVRDSCGFDDGMKKLEENDYDLIILDLCVGKAVVASDKIGEVIFKQIQKRKFIPIVFFTGLPEYLHDVKSEIVRVAAKADGYDALFEQIREIISSGVIPLKNEVQKIIQEGLRSYFWDFVHPNSKVITELKDDDVSLKYLLFRRLGKALSSEIVRATMGDAKLGKDLAHPMEFYIFPPVDGEYECGDIIRSRKDETISFVLTPSCDLIEREGKRKAEKVLIAHTLKLRETDEHKKYLILRESLKEKKQLSKEDEGKLKNSKNDVKKLMKPATDRYFFLPETSFIEAMLIDFQSKSSITYKELEDDFDVVATLDDPVAQSVLASYLRYYSRIGYRDLDIDFSFDKIYS